MMLRYKFALAVALLPSLSLCAEHVRDPKAGLVDVSGRREELRKTNSPRLKAAIASLKLCETLPPVAAPQGRMIIPKHYLNGSHGPVNPAEAVVTKQYYDFEKRVTAGMNEWLVTGNKNEAACAQKQIDTWAQAETLLDYDPKESSQAWYQVEWTLSSIAISESELVNEKSLDKAMVARDIGWMKRVANTMVAFDKAGKQTNNHHYWRGLAAGATGVVSNDDALFTWSVGVFKEGVGSIDQRGALPQEMARNERAIHYQSFALQALAPLAELATRQGIDLYDYSSLDGRHLGDAVEFLGDAMSNPLLAKHYVPDTQLTDFSAPDFLAGIEFYSHRINRNLNPAIAEGLMKPTYASRIGGNTTVLAGLTTEKR